MEKLDKPTRYYSERQEKRVSEKLGMKKVSNSGATRFDKGDIEGWGVLIECKTNIKKQKSFSIKKEWLDKNLQESVSMNKMLSILAFNFGEEKEDFVCMRLEDFKQLYEAWKENLTKY